MTVAYLVMRYPWRSQTFIAREMRGVAGQGITVEVHPIWDWRWRPPALPPEDVAAGLRLVRVSPWRVLGAAPGALRRRRVGWGNVRRAWAMVRAHRPRTFEGWLHTVWGGLWAAVRAEHFAGTEDDAPAHVHGAWATAPATAAMALGTLTGRPWSFGAHAYDLYRSGGDPLLAPKLARAAFVHTSTERNVRHLEEHFPGRRAPVILARRGLEQLGPGRPRQFGPGPDAGEGIRLLSVGRLVAKKGHVHQLAAIRELARRGRRCRLRIIGDGPLRAALAREVATGGLADRVELLGGLDYPAVEAAYAWAHVFWHTGIVDAAGDVDGLPNVVPEAMAHELPVISSAAGAATEAVRDGETGLLVDVTDPAALANAVERLANDGALRQRLGAAGRAWVEENFLAAKNTARLGAAFGGMTKPG